jgi:hypothetical protein
MVEKSILDMSNEEIIALVKRNKILREEATQEKMVVRQKETAMKDAKTAAKEVKNEAMDMLKAYMAEQEKGKKKS